MAKTKVLAEPELKLDAPEGVEFGAQKVRCGGTVYRALRCLMAEKGATTGVFCAAVWGREMKNETIRSVIWRVNSLMRGLRCKHRAMLSAGKVLFE